MQTTEQKQVYVAIAEVAKKIAAEGISKSKKNQAQGYSFRGIDEIYNALAMHLADAGLVIIPKILHRDFREVPTKNGGIMSYVVVEAEYDFISAKDGSMHTAKVIGEAMDSADKATNKAMSAAYKYLCLQTFCIPTEGDNDADAHTPVRVQPMAQSTPKPAIVKPAIVKPAVLEPVKPEISNNQFTQLLERVKGGDVKAYENAKGMFALNEKQIEAIESNIADLIDKN